MTKFNRLTFRTAPFGGSHLVCFILVIIALKLVCDNCLCILYICDRFFATNCGVPWGEYMLTYIEVFVALKWSLTLNCQ